ncbi:uncharacterized protein LOC144824350 [Lissotriton helveticus]
MTRAAGSENAGRREREPGPIQKRDDITTSDAAQMTTSAGASSVEGSTLDAAAPTGGAGGEDSAAADSVATPKKLTRKEMAVRARAHKLEAICAEYRRLWAREHEETSTSTYSSTAHGSTSQRPPASRRRRTAATKSATSPQILDGSCAPATNKSELPGAVGRKTSAPAPGPPQRAAGRAATAFQTTPPEKLSISYISFEIVIPGRPL